MSDEEASVHEHAVEIERSRPRQSASSSRLESSGSRRGSATSVRPGTGFSGKTPTYVSVLSSLISCNIKYDTLTGLL